MNTSPQAAGDPNSETQPPDSLRDSATTEATADIAELAQLTDVKRHTAPVTPLVHAVRVLAVLAVIFVFQFAGMTSNFQLRTLLIVGLVFILVVGVVLGLSYLQWQRLQYWFDADGDLRVSSGILEKKERRLQLSRLQSVEVVQPLLARVFGMAEVRVEVAGGGDSRITLAYLTVAHASALRAETLARAAGIRPDAGEAPEQALATVPAGVLFKASLLSPSVWMLVLAEVVIIAALVITGGLIFSLGFLIAVIPPFFAIFGFFSTYFNFTVADSPDGLRTRFGLLGVKAHTIPPGRVASIDFQEPLFWRHFGWVSLRITVAGTGSSSDDNDKQSSSMLLPVAPWPVALEVARRVLPNLDVANIPFAPAPARAKKRSPFQFRNLGVYISPEVFATRRGWLYRHTIITPQARIQSMRITRGPWERALGLASVHADIVPGPLRAVAAHRDAAEARQILFTQIAQIDAATKADTSTRWGRNMPRD